MVDMYYSRVGSKILRRIGYYGFDGQATHAHWCPACKEMHDIAVEQPFRNGASWTFNGDGDRPTFNPSVNIAVGPFPDGKVRRCHYFVRDGCIQYCGDCTHELSGQTIALPDVPDEVLKRVPEINP